MSSNIDKKKTINFIADYAFDYVQIFKDELNSLELSKRMGERIETLDKFFNELQLQIELLKAEAVQDYLLGCGTNDEEVNSTVLELRKQINQ